MARPRSIVVFAIIWALVWLLPGVAVALLNFRS
jgi:hypothetical protein